MKVFSVLFYMYVSITRYSNIHFWRDFLGPHQVHLDFCTFLFLVVIMSLRLINRFIKLQLAWERNPVAGYSVNFQSLPVPYFERNFAQKPAFHSLSIYYLKTLTVSSYKSATTGAQIFSGLSLIFLDLQSKHMYRQVGSNSPKILNKIIIANTIGH